MVGVGISHEYKTKVPPKNMLYNYNFLKFFDGKYV